MRASWGWGALSAIAGFGCGPWLTPIPTYWEYQDGPRVRSETVPPGEPVVIEPVPELSEAEDDYVAPSAPQCTAVYLITSSKTLFAFHPKDLRFERRGVLSCPEAGFSTPFSMAVARTGIAHVLYGDGRLYRVRLDDAACEATSFRPNQPPGFLLFGMGYGRREGKDALFVAHIPSFGPSRGLARIDTNSYELEYIGPFSENPGSNVELTPTGKGPLHGYFLNFGRGGTLVSIDTETAAIEKSIPLSVGSESSALAIAWWGGSFYIFTTLPGRGTQVSRYDEVSGALDEVATLPEVVVGAGVSTCAPQSVAR